MALNGKKILKYAALPGFVPRLRELFRSGFVHIAFLMASIYRSVRLLPAGHAYLDPQNFGCYGIRHVVIEASRNLVFSRRNIDQIFVFFTILTGLVLLMLQFCLLLLALLQQPALAIANPADWFMTPSVNTPFGPEQDLAFIILDHVFGAVGIFNSCVSTAVACLDNQGNPLPMPVAYPFPMHDALHQLLMFYSYGIFMVSVIVILYFVITIIGETAVSGTPFGQRFNRAWVPIRLIAFFALLAPLNFGGPNEGLNAAQLITLHVAKYGSNFATNAWNRFNTVLVGSYLGDLNDLMARPNVPEVGSLVQFLFVARACEMAEGAIHDNDIQAYIVREYVNGSDNLGFILTDFTTARNFSRNGKIIIRIGVEEPGENRYKGNINPLCGELSMEITDAFEPGSLAIMEAYYDSIRAFWALDIITPLYVECMMRRILPVDVDPTCGMWPGPVYAFTANLVYTAGIGADIDAAIAAQIAGGNWVDPILMQKGWAGAAIWYNRIAKMNGAVTTAALNLPRAEKYPMVMETIVAQRRAVDESVDGPERFDPLLADRRLADLPRDGDQYVAAALYAAYRFWEFDGYQTSHHTDKTGNVFIDTINSIFGTGGLFEMRRNPSVHPLAQLSAIGKSLIEATVRNLLLATAGVVGEGLSSILGDFIGKMGGAASFFLFNISSITLVMGVMLFYVLPFMPFVYFLFAVSGWVKSIFEAMVAMPLWALAHVRIDGEGLPGRAAANGYYLLFEIFVRPVLIIVGLLAGMSIFAALVMVLNTIFDLVVANTTGFDARCEQGAAAATCGPDMIEYYRSAVDEFFFTGIYVILVYLLGTGCFKLVDTIPNQILRWMGVTISTFQEDAGDPAGQLGSQVYRGTTVLSTQASGGRLAALTMG